MANDSEIKEGDVFYNDDAPPGFKLVKVLNVKNTIVECEALRPRVFWVAYSDKPALVLIRKAELPKHYKRKGTK